MSLTTQPICGTHHQSFASRRMAKGCGLTANLLPGGGSRFPVRFAAAPPSPYSGGSLTYSRALKRQLPVFSLPPELPEAPVSLCRSQPRRLIHDMLLALSGTLLRQQQQQQRGKFSLATIRSNFRNSVTLLEIFPLST